MAWVTPGNAVRALRTLWERFRTGFAHAGLEYAITAGLSYLPDWLLGYEHHVLLGCETGGPASLEQEGLEFRVATPADIEELSGVGHLTREILEHRFASGDLCVMGLEDDRVVAYVWGAVGRRYVLELGSVFDVPDDAFLGFDVFTRPDARRRGLATLCYERLYEMYAARGRRRVFTAVEVVNQASLRANERWGFVVVGRVRKIRALTLVLSVCALWPGRKRPFDLWSLRGQRRVRRARPVL